MYEATGDPFRESLTPEERRWFTDRNRGRSMEHKFDTKATEERVTLANGMVRSPSAGKANWTLLLKGPMLRRWMELLGRGAVVYGPNNWTLAMAATDPDERRKTKDRYIESAMRHFMQWAAGDRDEDHAAAVIFNLNGYEAMLETDPKNG